MIPTGNLKHFITNNKKCVKTMNELIINLNKLNTAHIIKPGPKDMILQNIRKNICLNPDTLNGLPLQVTQYDMIKNRSTLLIPDSMRAKTPKEIRNIKNQLVRESFRFHESENANKSFKKARVHRLIRRFRYTIIILSKRFVQDVKNVMENISMSSLSKAKLDVAKENPNLPMQLRFEVSSLKIINKLLSVEDLTLPTREDKKRNIIGRIYDQVLVKLKWYNFPNIQIVRGNPIVSTEDNFDNLLFSVGNAGRSSTYTRYVDENHVLMTHTSALVPQAFREWAKKKSDPLTFVFPGLVYRRDVIDPRHLDVFHQIDVWTLQESKKYGITNREDLLRLVRAVFEASCPDAKMIVYEAKHPYTINGIEVYAEIGEEKIEVLEAGLAHPEVLRKAGIDPEIYSGLALGMGIERLIMARKRLPDIRLIRSTDPLVIKQMANMEQFKNVSNQPAMSRDMSYCVSKNDTEEDICEAIRNAFAEKSDLLEQVEILERTPFEKLTLVAKERLGVRDGQDNVLVRIILRHPDKTLTKKQAAELYTMAYPILHQGTSKGYEVK